MQLFSVLAYLPFWSILFLLSRFDYLFIIIDMKIKKRFIYVF